MLSTIWGDLKHGARALSRQPGFALAAILTLGLGIGATTAIFSVVNGVLLRPLPYRDPSRLLTLSANQSTLDVNDLRDWNTTIAHGGGHTLQSLDLVGGNEPEKVDAVLVTGDLFATLGVPAARGRALGLDDDRMGGPPVVALTDAFWRRQLGGDPLVIGRTLTLSGRVYSVVGVMPPGFQMPGRDGDLFAPVSVVLPEAVKYRGVHFLRTVWRLKDGATQAQAQAEFSRLARRLEEQSPEEGHGRALTLESLTEHLVGDVRTALWILLGAVALVLLVACSNFANLLLARSVTRSHELAIRSSLGAGRGRLVRQLVTESLLLASAGGALGILIATWGEALLVKLGPELPRLNDLRVDAPVLGFGVALALVTGLVFGLLPALHASRAAIVGGLKAGSATTTTSGGAHRALGTLVVAQIALAVVLLVGAGLLLHGFWRLSSIQPGFDAHDVLSLRLELPESRYGPSATQTAYRTRVLEELNGLPGAQAAMISELPLTGEALMHNFLIDGGPAIDPADAPELMSRSVAGDYFTVMRIPQRAGRALAEPDRADAEPVGVVNEAFVRAYSPGQNVVGRRMRWAHEDPPRWISIVGVVADVKHFGLGDAEQPAIYTPYAQFGQDWKRWMAVVVRGRDTRTAAFASQVKQRIWAVDPQIPVTHLKPLEDVVGSSLSAQRFNLILLALFALAALTLAALGVFGVTSYVAAQRTREIGLRMALGAGQRDVFLLVLGRSLKLVAIGGVLGLIGAALAARFMRSLVVQVGTHDPATYAGVAAVLGAVALVAGMVPALRASRVDPVVALRKE